MMFWIQMNWGSSAYVCEMLFFFRPALLSVPALSRFIYLHRHVLELLRKPMWQTYPMLIGIILITKATSWCFSQVCFTLVKMW